MEEEKIRFVIKEDEKLINRDYQIEKLYEYFLTRLGDEIRKVGLELFEWMMKFDYLSGGNFNLTLIMKNYTFDIFYLRYIISYWSIQLSSIAWLETISKLAWFQDFIRRNYFVRWSNTKRKILPEEIN